MNCAEWEERIALHAGGDLAPGEAAEVERHLAECAGCQVFWSGMRESLAVLREVHGGDAGGGALYGGAGAGDGGDWSGRARGVAAAGVDSGDGGGAGAGGGAVAAAAACTRLRRGWWRRFRSAPLVAARPVTTSCTRAACRRRSGAEKRRAADGEAADVGPEYCHLLDCGLIQRRRDETNDFGSDAAGARRCVAQTTARTRTDHQAGEAASTRSRSAIHDMLSHCRGDRSRFQRPDEGHGAERHSGADVAAAEAAIKQLDVAPKNVELTVYFVMGGDNPHRWPARRRCRADIRDVIAQLKNAFTFKEYRMLDVLTLRTRTGSDAETSGILNTGYAAEDEPVLDPQRRPSATMGRSASTACTPGLRIPFRIPARQAANRARRST